jgi:hypothetical protein
MACPMVAQKAINIDIFMSNLPSILKGWIACKVNVSRFISALSIKFKALDCDFCHAVRKLEWLPVVCARGLSERTTHASR